MWFPRLTASVLFTAGVVSIAALGQPPAGSPDKVSSQPEKTAKKKPVDTVDAALAAALANDPDVLVARAKVQLAEAELTKARQAVVLKVMTLTAAVQEHRRSAEMLGERVVWAERMVKQGMLSQAQFIEDRTKLESAKAALARSEIELKLLTGGGGKDEGADGMTDPGIFKAYEYLLSQRLRDFDRAFVAHSTFGMRLREVRVTKGPVPDRIRGVLDSSVKLGPKGERIAFDKALEVIKKQTGFEIPLRSWPAPLPVIASEGEELPVGAWLQLYQDTGRFTLYVREYGLLVADKSTAPPDAPTLTEFWKQSNKHDDSGPKK